VKKSWFPVSTPRRMMIRGRPQSEGKAPLGLSFSSIMGRQGGSGMALEIEGSDDEDERTPILL